MSPTDVRTAQVFTANNHTVCHSHGTRLEYDYSHKTDHDVRVPSAHFLTFSKNIYSLVAAPHLNVISQLQRTCTSLSKKSESSPVNRRKKTLWFLGSEAWLYSHLPPHKESTPPCLLYSQLAYRDETLCVGGRTDEMGGPVCV